MANVPQDTEITLGTGRMLALFFALVVICAGFFAIGFSLGRKAIGPVTVLTAQASTPSSVHSFFSRVGETECQRALQRLRFEDVNLGPPPRLDRCERSVKPQLRALLEPPLRLGSGPQAPGQPDLAEGCQALDRRDSSRG